MCKTLQRSPFLEVYGSPKTGIHRGVGLRTTESAMVRTPNLNLPARFDIHCKVVLGLCN